MSDFITLLNTLLINTKKAGATFSNNRQNLTITIYKENATKKFYNYIFKLLTLNIYLLKNIIIDNDINNNKEYLIINFEKIN